ncbi:MAG: hypothetical protein CVT79_13805 [Alphaproteobacteria bacterium HGW-Alphaproteobacteria-18]|nr:MAG: hypothetical protein CVT79_13805 [Alphaproteobacteria bacterium HGW-Alphaproteobacteria-18]
MLVEAGGQWRAHRNHDARRKAAGRITPLIVNRLKAEGIVFADPARPSRLISDPSPPSAGGNRIPPPARLLEAGRPHRPVSLFTELAVTAAVQPGEMTRLKASARRFLADISQAAARQPSPRMTGQPSRADFQAAMTRLSVLEKEIGLGTVRQLECLLVDAAASAAFAQQSGCAVVEAPAVALAALRTLARAYDLAIKTPQ